MTHNIFWTLLGIGMVLSILSLIYANTSLFWVFWLPAVVIGAILIYVVFKTRKME